MPSLTVENYAKAIYQLAQQSDSEAVATGQIANALGVLPGTVTSWPRPIDRTMSCEGLTTDWAMAWSVGAAASGARAHAAISADFRRRLFIVLPLISVS